MAEDKGALAEAEARLAAATDANAQAEAACVAARHAVEELMPSGFDGDRCYDGLRSWVRKVLYTDEQEAREAILKKVCWPPCVHHCACTAAFAPATHPFARAPVSRSWSATHR